ncbi:CARDB domain-containing protein [Methanosarcina barkeri]|uniref:CARDB domain-containing protein n=1 Tax=Methanosarcina barkeri TaxID=2208 RepID=UPI0006D288CC|nr:CARDB domain-containing protein [Methanosarcina barkeri]
MKTEISKIIILFVFLLSLLISIPPTGASYSFEGIPLTPDAQGTFQGEVYIDGGHGLAFPPYSENFSVPDGTVRWARLYIGVWGGTENYEGWVQPKFNGQKLEQLPLAGVNDESKDVYCAGHGVYWVSYDVSNITKNGKNMVNVLTSKGEPGNKLDGRVYGAVLAAACENKKASTVSYQLLSGNVNLHGKGWSGTLANSNDVTNVNFSCGQALSSKDAANLSVVYLTGTKGLPDYLEFNGKMLGTSPKNLSEKYGENVRDVADEISNDAYGGEGPISRYFDIESFNVLDYLQANNSAAFLRGIDMNGDGEIDEQEGEDYLHPVLAALILTSKDTASVLPDLYPEMNASENELVDGTPAKVSFTINNPGGICDQNCTVSFRVDGNEVSTIPIQMTASGVYSSSISWPAVKGKHLLELSVNPKNSINESNNENNACALNVNVKSKPDLSVSLGDPVKIETKTEAASSSIICLSFLSILGSRRKKPILLLLLAVFLIMALSGCVEESHATEKNCYSIPVKIVNNGEASARNFDVNISLDGKSVTVLNIPELAGQKTIVNDIQVETLSGEHTIKAKVDENNHIIESDDDNNEFEASRNFT